MRRSSNETGLAFAMVTSSSIAADRCRSTRVRKTLVDVHAFSCNSLEPVLAEALAFYALGIVHTVEVRFAKRSHVGLQFSRCHGTSEERGEKGKPIKTIIITCSQATVGLGLALYPVGQMQL